MKKENEKSYTFVLPLDARCPLAFNKLYPRTSRLDFLDPADLYDILEELGGGEKK